jgi:hypothetical protein
MSPFEGFQLYMALKAHFNQKTYDYFKYNGKTKHVSIDSFNKRKDRYFFAKLAKHTDPRGLIISNMLIDRSLWVGDLVTSPNSEQIWTDWRKNRQALTYHFTTQIAKAIISNNFSVEQLIRADTGYPEIHTLYLNGEISAETLVVFTDCVRCYRYWDKQLKDDLLWDQIGSMIIKYAPFLEYDSNACKIIIKKYDKQLTSARQSIINNNATQIANTDNINNTKNKENTNDKLVCFNEEVPF